MTQRIGKDDSYYQKGQLGISAVFLHNQPIC